MSAYYNDNDPEVCLWLRELIKRRELPDGEVDERSILDVRPADVRGFTHVHFFAGIGGWAYALKIIGWPIDRPVWTGSPPCQPFSAAGKGLSSHDPRHLAPHYVRLVRAARPDLLFGEQVASSEVFGPTAKGNRPGFEGQPPWAWLDDLSDRLEAARYAIGASDIPAAGVGAPHIRQRTFFGAISLDRMADMHGNGCQEAGCRKPEAGRDGPFGDRATGGLGDGLGAGLEGQRRNGDRRVQPGRINQDALGSASEAGAVDEERPSPLNGFWQDADWLFCRDDRFRPVEPGSFPLADGVPARVVRLRGYGNAINPWAAAEFMKAFCRSAWVSL